LPQDHRLVHSMVLTVRQGAPYERPRPLSGCDLPYTVLRV